MKKEIISKNSNLLPLEGIEVMENELLLVLGGFSGSARSGEGCGCSSGSGCNCAAGKNCGCGCNTGTGCGCSGGAGCDCSFGQGCGCGCVPTVVAPE